MFYPSTTIRTFDRNIYNGQGRLTQLNAKSPVEVLYYYRGNVVVGKFDGKQTALVYQTYARDEFLPIEIRHEGTSYCGWVNRNQIELTA